MEVIFTPRELDIMAVLWYRGPSTVAEVRDALDDDLAYNTVLTVLRVLEDKEYVGHEEEGRAHRYHALVQQEDAGEAALGRIVRKMFGGSAELMLTQLVSKKNLSDDTLRRMRDLLDEHLGEEEK